MPDNRIPNPRTGRLAWAVLLPALSLLSLAGFYGANSKTSSSSALASAAISRPPVGRMLAAQVPVFVAQDYAALEDCLSRLQTAGINTLIVRVFQHPSDRLHAFATPRVEEGVYFETTHAPVVDPVLKRIVTTGHRYGLSVFAWMETRKTPLHVPDPEGARARAYSFGADTLEPISMWSVFDKAVEKGLIGLYEDAVRSGVDGILFQDDLVMHHHEDFSARAVALFEKETGLELDPKDLYRGVFQNIRGRWCVSGYSDLFWVWAYWKNEKLLHLAERLIRAARDINPRIQVAMNFMYESVTEPKKALAWLSQDLNGATELPIDYFAIMAYHRQMKAELKISKTATYDRISSMTARLLSWIEDPYMVLMKVQVSDWETSEAIPAGEAQEVLKRIRDQGQVSVVFVPYSCTTPLPAISRHLSG